MGEFDKIDKEAIKEAKKRKLLFGMGICVVIIIVLAVMVIYLQRKDANTFKTFVNGMQVAVSADFKTYDESGNVYIKAQELASLLGWKYEHGEYGDFSENKDAGYMQNGYEIASFASGSKTLKKYTQVTALPPDKENPDRQYFNTKSPNGTLESSTLSLPVLYINEQVYLPLADVVSICNCSYNADNINRLQFFTQENLIDTARTKAAEFGYTALNGTYENLRSLARGMMVVQSGSSFGVVGLYDNHQYIGFKYTDIVYRQNVNQFFVQATDNKDEKTVGVVGINGDQIIAPKSYEDISVLEDQLGLYLVEKEGKYGVLNGQGDVVVHAEYDQIGLNDDFVESYKLEDKFVIFNNTLVDYDNAKYGFYSLDEDVDSSGNVVITGKETAKPSYISLGYDPEKDDDAEKNYESVITFELDDVELPNGDIKQVQGIVVQQEVLGETKYGVYDAVTRKLLLPCSFDRVYSVTEKGETQYYMTAGTTTATVQVWLHDNPSLFD